MARVHLVCSWMHPEHGRVVVGRGPSRVDMHVGARVSRLYGRVSEGVPPPGHPHRNGKQDDGANHPRRNIDGQQGC